MSVTNGPISSSDGFGVTTSSTSGWLIATKGDIIRVVTPKSPLAAGTGQIGEICWDTGFVYICTAANTWKRAALTGGY